MCQSFIDLDAFVSQDYLNNINNNFRSIITVLNETLFPDIEGTVEAIKEEFGDFQFQSSANQEIYLHAMDKLDEFADMSRSAKEVIFTKIKEINDHVVDLINRLEIASLNSIFQLGNVVKEEFESFFNTFPELAKEILSFQTLVDGDFKILFDFKGFLDDIKQRI